MSIHDYNEQYAAYVIYAGLAIAAIGFLWLYVRAARSWGKWLWFPPSVLAFALARLRQAAAPLAVLVVGALCVAAPAIVTRFVPVDLGPNDRIVNGERHLTLTGWDRTSYSFLKHQKDVVVLQMANPDVTDETLALLDGFTKLRELDVSKSKITDAGLARIAALPALTTLFLNNTRVTGPGVKEHLNDHPNLKVLWLRGTSVDQETVAALKAAKPGRRVTADAPRS